MRISDWSSDVCSSDLFGFLTDRMRVKNGDVISIAGSGLIQPRAEGEIAFVLKKDLKGPGVTEDQVLDRSEEHTSELQSLMRISYAVFCLKKKKNQKTKKEQDRYKQKKQIK